MLLLAGAEVARRTASWGGRGGASGGLAIAVLLAGSGCPLSDDYEVTSEGGGGEGSMVGGPFGPIGGGAEGSGAGSGTGAGGAGASGTGATGSGASGTGGSGGSPVIPPCTSNPPSDPVCPPECDDCVNGMCRLTCVGKDACKAQALVCPDGHACSVECLGDAACQDAEIECPSSHACVVVCDGKDACNKAYVSCGAGDCTMDCGNGTACKDSSMACYPGGACSASCSGEAPDMLACSAACACQTCGGGGDDDD